MNPTRFNAVYGNPNYNLDYDLHVLDPENKDTKDYQRNDCVFDALQRVDKFIKEQVNANMALLQDNQMLRQQIEMLRNQITYGRH